MNRKIKNRKNNEGDSLYISRAGWYSLKYPAEWELEENEECITIYNPNEGVGALQVSAYSTPADENPRDILAGYLLDIQDVFDKGRIRFDEVGKKKIATYDYINNHWYKKVWFISQESCLILVSYNCKVEHQEHELEKIEKIIRSIEVTVSV
jgi:hypothetical protein